ncbi:hypothetical protein [Mucilaginibacter sp. OK283]|jgi:hypothetical protein|uniref:hypothetical protein n=1 Tax=Mucilaginibacter sp. OK283 TaxID=1881049 RepID=UPI0008B0E1E9|nr:hypothetical protein [Mucilaginibacter sp. OK283]SEO72223.1 hypothetical protein SAMN05428947_103548 [Mucilaginibacter sp. OK283]
MKTKEEILNSFYTTGADGVSEISAPDLLKAMEAYKQQSLADAFNAARKLKDEFAPTPNYQFKNLEDYIKSTEIKVVKNDKDELSEQIALVADSVLPNFLPDDPTVTEFAFDFNMMGIGYTAFYTKDADGYWQMVRWRVGRE